jgi:hypothetical protein
MPKTSTLAFLAALTSGPMLAASSASAAPSASVTGLHQTIDSQAAPLVEQADHNSVCIRWGHKPIWDPRHGWRRGPWTCLRWIRLPDWQQPQWSGPSRDIGARAARRLLSFAAGSMLTSEMRLLRRARAET